MFLGQKIVELIILGSEEATLASNCIVSGLLWLFIGIKVLKLADIFGLREISRTDHVYAYELSASPPLQGKRWMNKFIISLCKLLDNVCGKIVLRINCISARHYRNKWPMPSIPFITIHPAWNLSTQKLVAMASENLWPSSFAFHDILTNQINRNSFRHKWIMVKIFPDAIISEIV